MITIFENYGSSISFKLKDILDVVSNHEEYEKAVTELLLNQTATFHSNYSNWFGSKPNFQIKNGLASACNMIAKGKIIDIVFKETNSKKAIDNVMWAQIEGGVYKVAVDSYFSISPLVDVSVQRSHTEIPEFSKSIFDKIHKKYIQKRFGL